MAQTKVKLISDGVIDVNHLASGHSITTDNIGEGSNLYYTDARVSTYLSTNSYATESYVTTAVANLVDSAPTTLDTLNELAAALGDDPNFATTVTNSIATKLPLAGGNITGNLTVDTNTLYVDVTSNRVGIGTSSPYHNLEVYGTDATSMVHYNLNSKGGLMALSNQRIALTTTSINDDLVFGYAPANSPSSADFVERMRIDNGTGDVSIGTDTALLSNPGRGNLTIEGTSDSILTLGIGGAAKAWFYTRSSDNHSFLSTTSNLIFESSGEKLRMSSTGILDFNTDSSEASHYDKLAIGVNGTSYSWIQSYGGRKLYINNLGNDVVFPNSVAKVGIGTTSPNEKLEVVGKILSRYGSSTNHAVIEHRDTSDNVIFSFRRSDGSGGNGNDLVVRAFEDIHLSAGNNDASNFVVKSSGNVGIGLTNPSQKLHAAGTIYTNNGNFKIDDGYEVSWGNGNTSILGNASAGYLDFRTGNATKMYIDPNGKVGIGVTGLSYLFETKSVGTTGLNAYFGTGTVRIGGNQDAGSNQVLSLAPGRLGMDAPGVPNGRFIVEENGRLGLGTSTPKTQFHMNGGGSYNNTDQNNRLFIERNSHAYILYSVPDGFDSGIHFHNTTDNAFVGRIAYSHDSGGDALAFRVGTASGLGHVIFTSNKRVGIGSLTSPSSTLHVSDNIAGNVAITVQNQDGARSSQLRFLNSSGTEKTALTFVPTDTSFRLYHNGADQFCITSNGEMSLGDDDTYAISTDRINSIGSINRAGLGSSAYARLVMQERTGNWISFVNGTPVHYGTISLSGSGVSYGSNSDYRLKENILDLTNSIDKVKLLNPKTFNFVSNPDQNVTGFIAHEVQEVIPEAVVGEKDGVVVTGNIVEDATGKLLEVNVEQPDTLEDGTSFVVTKTEPKYQQLDPAKLVAVLTGAIKELVEKVEYLENEINSIKNG